MEVREALDWLVANGWTQESVAEALDVSQPTVSRWFGGADPRGKNRDALFGLVRSQRDVSTRHSNHDWMVHVVGYVGAGAIVHTVDDHEKGSGLETIELDFPVRHGTVAVIVRGDSMFPVFEDGDVIGYMRTTDDPDVLVGQTCVVKVVDGPMYIKRLKKGSARGYYTLSSANAPDIEDQAVEWAAPYVFRLPRQSWRRLSR